MCVLRQLYPKGINFEKVKLAEPYLSKAKKFNLHVQISLMDRICSGAFSTTFVLTLMALGFSIAFTVFTIPMQLGHEYPMLNENILFRSGSAVLLVSWGLFLYVDLLTGGLLRRWKTIGKLYYPVYVFFNTISLGFLWRPLLVTLVSNLPKKMVIVATIFAPLAFFVVGGLAVDDEGALIELFDRREYEIAAVMAKDQYYRNKLSQEEWISHATIQSNIITSNYLEISVPYYEFADLTIDSLSKEKKYFSDILSLSINDSLLLKPSWIGNELKNGQKVAVTVIDITSLPKALHLLKVRLKGSPLGDFEIPFWKQ